MTSKGISLRKKKKDLFSTYFFAGQMVSPMKSVSVSGKINSVRPLSIGLLSRVDESVLRTDLTLDRGERSLTLKTTYDRGEIC